MQPLERACRTPRCECCRKRWEAAPVLLSIPQGWHQRGIELCEMPTVRRDVRIVPGLWNDCWTDPCDAAGVAPPQCNGRALHAGASVCEWFVSGPREPHRN